MEKLGIVLFGRGREGPMAGWEGKPAFPGRGLQGRVDPGDILVVLRARPNPRGTVFFLEGALLEEALRDEGLRGRLERELPWTEVHETPSHATSWLGEKGRYAVLPGRKGLLLYLQPWGSGEEEILLPEQRVGGVYIPAQRAWIPFTRPGETPAWIRLDRAVPGEWAFRPLPEVKPPAKVRPTPEKVLVGHRVPVWPKDAAVVWQEKRIREVRWPLMEEPVYEEYPANTHEWVLLEERLEARGGQEPIYGHYGDESWVAGWETRRERVWVYRLRHRETGEEVEFTRRFRVSGWASRETP